jgi:hypothetical protein
MNLSSTQKSQSTTIRESICVDGEKKTFSFEEMILFSPK